jgi:hypothetical protein
MLMMVIERNTLPIHRPAPAAGLFGWHRAAECTGRCVEINPEEFSTLYAQPCICKRPRRFDCLLSKNF